MSGRRPQSERGQALAGLAALVLLVLVSALGVVYVEHRARTVFVELQALREARDALEVEWGRLQLEQSTWATHGRVERIAGQRLDMYIPAPDEVVIVRP